MRGVPLECNNGYTEKPALEAAKALYLLQSYDEFEDEIQSLKKKLMSYFEDSPSIDNIKSYQGMHYASNGLCYYAKTPTNYHDFDVLLDPWEGEVIEEDPEKENKADKPKYSFVALKGINLFLYNMIKLYMGRRISLGTDTYYSGKYSVKEFVRMYEAYIKLTDEEKLLVKKNDMFSNIDRCLSQAMEKIFTNANQRSYGYNYHTAYTIKDQIRIPTEDGLKRIIDFYTQLFSTKGDGYFTSDDIQMLFDFITKELASDEYAIVISNVAELTKKGNFNDRYSYGAEYSIEKFYENLYLPLKKLAEEDKYYKKIFSKMKIV
jgi:hypothetical protein